MSPIEFETLFFHTVLFILCLPFFIVPIFDSYLINWIPGFVWFFLKVGFLLFVFLWVRATLPRFRYDQLMRLGWKVFLPLSLLWVFLTATFLVFFDLLPNYER